MPLTTTEKMLQHAHENHCAVGAFNAENLEMVQAIVAAAEETNSPVIIQTTPSTVKYASLELFFAMVAAEAQKASVPVALHLDHGDSFELAMKALKAGYTSIMIDGSHLEFEENIELTRRVVEACSPNKIPVEAELGKVGGKEDDRESDGYGYTDPQEAVRFVAETKASSLAVGVGTAHGIYAETPVLNLDLITELNKVLTIPMVLHGASGLSAETVKECVARGICKVNFATELRVAFTDAVKQYLAEKPDTFDPKKYGTVARNAVKELVKDRICLLK